MIPSSLFIFNYKTIQLNCVQTPNQGQNQLKLNERLSLSWSKDQFPNDMIIEKLPTHLFQ